MGLSFHPKVGHILMCDFGEDSPHQPPEMCKKRPVVVVSKELPGRPGLCTVVPISTREPHQIEDYHHLLSDASLPAPLKRSRSWAKCDMVTTVSLSRLDGVRGDRHPTTGKRVFYTRHKVTAEDLDAISKGIVSAIQVIRWLEDKSQSG